MSAVALEASAPVPRSPKKGWCLSMRFAAEARPVSNKNSKSDPQLWPCHKHPHAPGS